MALSREEAVAQAKQLLAKMNTPGWAMRIWENLGWHYAVENTQGMISVYPSFPRHRMPMQYFCMMTDQKNLPGVGSMMWNDEHHYLDPNEAVRRTVELAREKVDELNTLVREVECDLNRRGAI